MDGTATASRNQRNKVIIVAVVGILLVLTVWVWRRRTTTTPPTDGGAGTGTGGGATSDPVAAPPPPPPPSWCIPFSDPEMRRMQVTADQMYNCQLQPGLCAAARSTMLVRNCQANDPECCANCTAGENQLTRLKQALNTTCDHLVVCPELTRGACEAFCESRNAVASSVDDPAAKRFLGAFYLGIAPQDAIDNEFYAPGIRQAFGEGYLTGGLSVADFTVRKDKGIFLCTQIPDCCVDADCASTPGTPFCSQGRCAATPPPQSAQPLDCRPPRTLRSYGACVTFSADNTKKCVHVGEPLDIAVPISKITPLGDFIVVATVNGKAVNVANASTPAQLGGNPTRVTVFDSVGAQVTGVDQQVVLLKAGLNQAIADVRIEYIRCAFGYTLTAHGANAGETVTITFDQGQVEAPRLAFRVVTLDVVFVGGVGDVSNGTDCANLTKSGCDARADCWWGTTGVCAALQPEGAYCEGNGHCLGSLLCCERRPSPGASCPASGTSTSVCSKPVLDFITRKNVCDCRPWLSKPVVWVFAVLAMVVLVMMAAAASSSGASAVAR